MPRATHIRSLDIAPHLATANVLFHSDWSTATGTSDAALRDTNKAYPWDTYKGTSSPTYGTRIEPVAALPGAATSPGFTNAMVVSSVNSSAEGTRLLGSLPDLAVGTSRFYRWYVNVLATDANTGHENAYHCYDIRIRPEVGYDLFFPVIWAGDATADPGYEDTWQPEFNHREPTGGLLLGERERVLGTRLDSATHPYEQPNGGQGGSIFLDKRRWYGVEFEIHRLSTTTYQLREVWIYDHVGNTLYDKTNFYHNDATNTSLADSTIVFPIDTTQIDSQGRGVLQYWNAGVNGFPPGNELVYDFSATGSCVVASTRIGTYKVQRGY